MFGIKNLFKKTVSATQRGYATVKGMIVSGLVAFSVLAAPAFAAVPLEVSTALTDAKADSLVVAGLALVIIIAIAAFKFMRRAV